jgi:hypothetical protein
VLDARNY